jgi:hypothetical protein
MRVVWPEIVTTCQEGFAKPEPAVHMGLAGEPVCTVQLLAPPPLEEMPIAVWAVASLVMWFEVQKLLLPLAAQYWEISRSSFQTCSGT